MALSVERVKCTECSNMILPQTAAANSGLCAPCAKTPEWLRREKRQYEAKFASGVVFTPSGEERALARAPREASDPNVIWRPEPEFYKGSGVRSVQEVIAQASGLSHGLVFLISDRCGRLSLSFNGALGVCEYRNDSARENSYAYTPDNLHEQVSVELHLAQACSSCGVETLWYPSRFHMPRQTAFAVVTALAAGDPALAVPVEWLDCGDISYTSRGQG